MHGSAETTSTQARAFDAHAMAHGAYPTATFACYGHSTLTFLSTLPQPSFHEASSAAWAANHICTILRVNAIDIPHVGALTACTSM